jgi:putative ABC transport system permease protein
MHALDIKLLRDFRRLWAQALAIALVLACGVLVVLTAFGMYGALETTRAAYYERQRFADVFAEANRAPNSLLPALAAIDGVLGVDARVSGLATLDVPGGVPLAVGQVLSLPADDGELNRLVLRAGRMPEPGATDQIVVNAPFAEANGLRPGDRLTANLDGRQRVLTVTGTALSPEFIYTIGPGALMPDNRRFGILWMPTAAAAAAFDMEGAFNKLALRLAAGADTPAVIAAVDRLLDPYGGLGAHGRDLQVSNSFIDAELQQLQSTAWVLPPVFFLVAAFLVNMVIGRIVELERAEIGLLKALGYRDRAVLGHYLLLAGLIALTGIAIGWIVGSWLAAQTAALYATFFDFPFLIHTVSPAVYGLSALLGLAAAGFGAAHSAWRAARLAPAIAMAPPAPPRFSRGLADRMLTRLALPQTALMVLRGLLRWPVRAGLSSLGLAASVAVVVAAGYLDDALEQLMDVSFRAASRQDATVILSHETGIAALGGVARLPGVLHAEPQQDHAVILRHGPREKRVGLQGLPASADLTRTVDAQGNPVSLPRAGLVLPERLARQLDVAPGDTVEVAFLTGTRRRIDVPVADTVTQYFGLTAFIDLAALDRLLGQSPRMTSAQVALDPAATSAFEHALADVPGVAGAAMMTDIRRVFRETLQHNVAIMTTIYVTVAMLIAVGVAYNAARIQLSERARELASLRILGFTRAEVSLVLLGETVLLALVAQPLGWAMGAGLAVAMTAGFESDLYAIPLVLERAAFARASLVVLATSLGAALIVRRRIDRMDLVAVMKTRE